MSSLKPDFLIASRQTLHNHCRNLGELNNFCSVGHTVLAALTVAASKASAWATLEVPHISYPHKCFLVREYEIFAIPPKVFVLLLSTRNLPSADTILALANTVWYRVLNTGLKVIFSHNLNGAVNNLYLFFTQL